MNAGLTPAAPPAASGYQVDDLVMDVRTRQITRDGVDLGVTSLSFDLLLALVRASPHLVTFDRLIEVVWPGVVVSPETLTQRVKLLRQALGDSADNPRYIIAVRGHGYRMAVPVTPLSELPPPSRTFAANEERAERPLAAPRESIAVLPFANLTGDPSKEYLSDGMAEEMINALGQVPGLKVPARTSSFAYKGRPVDVRRIGQDLGVGTILEGSVRSAGERLRISAQIVDARSGYQIWSQSYDRELGDIFKLQDDLAGAVVRAFRSTLQVDLPDSAARKLPTRDVDAYHVCLQAESIVNGTPESFLAAIALYDEALARDPEFARALSGRAMNRAALVWIGSPLGRGLEDAQRDAERALALDPTDARAHVVLASISALSGDWPAAEASFRAAIAANPLDAEVRGRYAITLLLPTGQLRKALAEATEARRLAPGNSFPAAMLAFVNQALGADEDAIRSADVAISRGGDPRQMAPVYAATAARRGCYIEAANYVINVLPPALRDAGGAETLRQAYAALGDPTKKKVALAALRKLTSTAAWERVDPRSKQGVLYVYAALGAIDELYHEMNRMLRLGISQDVSKDISKSSGVYPDIIAIGSMWSPEMRPFRQDPRFAALLEQLGLPGYWKQLGASDVAVESLDMMGESG
jgi:TolB-like protein